MKYLLGLLLVSLLASAAIADNAVDVTNIASNTVVVGYSCVAGSGATSVQVMIGDPTADSPSATGEQDGLTCDGAQHTATIALTTTAGQPPLHSGEQVQVRVGLVDLNDNVVTGQNKLVTLA
ncbi:hypothetical protein EMPS_02862 [Entomortierella parvispora]|uniref:Uncharacterized protein n=1 Tax=Entomortierella parvispora TaxID=205924 RepID=A0A9P3H694_9FUNG|nr:hypothetical protein EMPS_02862 [Entomortierella parvispora]